MVNVFKEPYAGNTGYSSMGQHSVKSGDLRIPGQMDKKNVW
jgi:hypothetical protein